MENGGNDGLTARRTARKVCVCVGGGWLTFTLGRTFILAADAPLPMGALGKQACHLLTGRGGLPDGTEHTVISTCCKECIIQAVWFLFFCRPAAIFARKTTGIYCQTTGVSAHHDILCLQIMMNECQRCLHLKGHIISMDIAAR